MFANNVETEPRLTFKEIDALMLFAIAERFINKELEDKMAAQLFLNAPHARITPEHRTTTKFAVQIHAQKLQEEVKLEMMVPVRDAVIIK